MISPGSQRAFEEMYDYYRPFIYNVAHKLIADNELVKEVLQDVFMEIWRRRESVISIQNFRGYLYSMARNVIFNHLKAQSHAPAAAKGVIASIWSGKHH